MTTTSLPRDSWPALLATLAEQFHQVPVTIRHPFIEGDWGAVGIWRLPLVALHLDDEGMLVAVVQGDEPIVYPTLVPTRLWLLPERRQERPDELHIEDAHESHVTIEFWPSSRG